MTTPMLTIASAPGSWRPAPVELRGSVDPDQVAALADLLGVDAPGLGDPIRPLWHEVLLRDPVRWSELGVDGHPRSSALLPPIADRRRMFGGSVVRAHGPLRVGEDVRRTVRATDVRHRPGRSGDLLLVTEAHAWTVEGELLLEEQRSIIYRSAAAPVEPSPMPDTTPGRRDAILDERALFLFSALTRNTHRIHYDAAYARTVEGHRGLLVQGPLTALLAAEAVHRKTRRAVTTFDYRLVGPCHVGEPLSFAVTPSDDNRVRVTGRAAERECLTAIAELK